MTTLQQYASEIVIDNSTGESYLSGRALARVCGRNESTIRDFIGARNFTAKTAEILTAGGLQGARLYGEQTIAEAIAKYNPQLAGRLLVLGVRKLLHELAGWQKQEPQKPQSALECILVVTQELIATNKRVEAIEDKLERHLPAEDYYTLLAYVNLHPELPKPTHYPSAGKALVKLSASLGVPVKSTADAKYGSCNTYHTSVLEAYFRG